MFFFFENKEPHTPQLKNNALSLMHEQENIRDGRTINK